MKHLTILISPRGEKFYSGYDGRTKEKDKAIHFISKEIAEKNGISSIFGNQNAYWNCEIESARRVRESMKGWTYKTICFKSARKKL